MTKETIVIEKITASEGKMLTNGDVVADTIYLGKADSIDNWHEIDIEED